MGQPEKPTGDFPSAYSALSGMILQLEKHHPLLKISAVMENASKWFKEGLQRVSSWLPQGIMYISLSENCAPHIFFPWLIAMFVPCEIAIFYGASTQFSAHYQSSSVSFSSAFPPQNAWVNRKNYEKMVTKMVVLQMQYCRHCLSCSFLSHWIQKSCPLYST